MELQEEKATEKANLGKKQMSFRKKQNKEKENKKEEKKHETPENYPARCAINTVLDRLDGVRGSRAGCDFPDHGLWVFFCFFFFFFLKKERKEEKAVSEVCSEIFW
jgi:hypothetical protein